MDIETLNTRKDYEYLKQNFPESVWRPKFQALLDDRMQWVNKGKLANKADGVEIAGKKKIVTETLRQEDGRNGVNGYATIGDQLDMFYWDQINGTTTWVDHVTSVKAKFPVSAPSEKNYQYEMQEDANSKIFRLGFTVKEVEGILVKSNQTIT